MKTPLLAKQSNYQQYGQTLASLIMLQAELSSKLYYLNIFPKIVKYLLTVKICDTSCSCLPPYSLYIPSMIWPLPRECLYHVLPTYTGRKGGDWREPGRRNLIIQGRKLYIHIMTKRNMTRPDVFAVLCL